VIKVGVVKVIITERGACHHHPVGGTDLEMDRMGKAHIDDFIDDTVTKFGISNERLLETTD
jgi:hypothetical protein